MASDREDIKDFSGHSATVLFGILEIVGGHGVGRSGAEEFVETVNIIIIYSRRGALVRPDDDRKAGLVGWCWAPRSVSDTIFRCQNF